MKNNNDIIEKIDESIQKNSNIMTSMGVSNGIAGISLFHYYRYKQTDNTRHNDLILSYLEKSIDGLNDEYQGNSLIQDIIEIGILIKYYSKKELIDESEFDIYNDYFSPILDDILKDNIINKNLSPVNGSIFIGRYFIKTNQSYSKIKPIVDSVLRNSINHEESKGKYWIANIQRQGKNYVEFGITHGISGIINFLYEVVSTYELDLNERKIIDETIIQSINFLLYHISTSQDAALFPFGIDYSDKNDQTLNLAYGDLGVLHSIKICSKYLGKADLQNFAETHLKRISNIKHIENIKDANILYGSTGFLSFYNILYPHLIDENFKKYWIDKTISFSNNNTEFAGFNANFNQFDINTQLSFANGIVGIGICLINCQLEDKNEMINYLDFIKLN